MRIGTGSASGTSAPRMTRCTLRWFCSLSIEAGCTRSPLRSINSCCTTAVRRALCGSNTHRTSASVGCSRQTPFGGISSFGCSAASCANYRSRLGLNSLAGRFAAWKRFERAPISLRPIQKESTLRSRSSSSARRILTSRRQFEVFKAYEAARQLARGNHNDKKMAIVVVDGMSWPHVDFPLTNDWVDWRHPGFLGTDPAWSAFLDLQEKRYGSIRDNVQATICSLDRLWIVREEAGFEFTLVKEALNHQSEERSDG
jgi:hypothetical protein